MKRVIIFLSCCMAALLVRALKVNAQPAAAAHQPVYIVLTTTVDDYVNWGTSEERLRRTIALLEKYRKAAPVNETFYFSGAMSDALAQHDPQDHLLDYVRSRTVQGILQPGYDGFNEPTYDQRPMFKFSPAQNTPSDHWLVRMDVAKKLLTEARDPLTGALLPGKSGGLKRMQEVFGPATAIRGVVLQTPNLYGPIDETGSDAEILNTLRQSNQTAMMPGLAESDLAHTSGSSFRPWANVFSRAISPDANTSPELFWQEDELRLSETSMNDWPTRRADDGLDKLKAALAGLDRSRVRVLRIELGGQRIYVKPVAPPEVRVTLPLAWAFKHPESPIYPANLQYSADQVQARYAEQEAVLKYLITDFLPANPGSRFVSVASLKGMAKPGWGYDLPFATLHEAVVQMLATWGDKPSPPAFVKAGDNYLSLADLFEVMTDALAQRGKTGSLPKSVHVSRVFGPLSTAQPADPVTGEVTAGSVDAVCAKLIGPLHDDSWSAIPHNTIPSPVQIDGLSLVPSQFLRLMAEALLAPTTSTKLTVRPETMFAEGQLTTYGQRRLASERGAAWTYKPAVVAK